MNFIDLFSGIGGFRSGLEKNGHKCLAYSEIDKFAKQSYQAIYSTENEVDLDDITKVSDEYFRNFREKCDIIVGGFPCQAFSIAGKRRGFEDTRGTLFFHIARAIKEIKPSFVLLENVKGLFSHDKGRTFGTIIQALDELGYVVEWQLFNSKYWGVPQNRERVYILVTRKDVFKRPILFDLGQKQKSVNTRLIDALENDVEESYYLSDEKIAKLTLNDDLSGKLNHYNYRELDTVHSTEKVAPTLNTMQGGDRQPKIAIKNFKEIVSVRKYDVDKVELSKLLRKSKSKLSVSNATISKELGVPITKVEHWFRKDNSFSIPEPKVWFGLKKILEIETNAFDEGITTFIRKESDFDTTNRVYDVEHLSPTLNTTSETKIAIPVLTPDRVNKRQNGRRFKENGEPMFTLTAQDKHGIAIKEATKKGYAIATQGDSVNYTYPTSTTRRGRVGKQVAQTLQAGDVNQGAVLNDLRIRKLTPLECWRLQGFTDEQFHKAKNIGISNSQLYKQAGNAVTVNVVDAIISKIDEYREDEWNGED